MKIKVPRAIKIGEHTYQIKQPPDFIRDTGNRACVTWHRKLIEIEASMEADTAMVSFLHEVVHIIDRHILYDHLNEDDTACLAEGVYQLFVSLGIELDWSEIE